MDLLDCRTEAANATRLQTAAMMCVVDAYDRKLQREHFALLVDAAMALHTQVGKMFMMVSVQDNYRQGNLDGGVIDRAVKGIEGLTLKAHDDLIGLMGKVVSCPTSQDKVH